MSYKVGDKVVMEITDKISIMGESNYILSDATVVNQGYIDKAAEPLSTYIEQARAEGEQVAWELARKIVRQPISGGYKQSEFEEIFGCGYISDIFEKYTYSEAAAKVEAWEKAKEEIKAGDVFEFTSGGKAVVMKVYEDGEVALFFPDGGCGIYKPHRSWHKTGRHIDIDGFLKQIRGGDDEK